MGCNKILKVKFTVLQVFLKKQEKSQIDKPTYKSKGIRKRKTNRTKVSRVRK